MRKISNRSKNINEYMNEMLLYTTIQKVLKTKRKQFFMLTESIVQAILFANRRRGGVNNSSCQQKVLCKIFFMLAEDMVQTILNDVTKYRANNSL